MNSTYTFQDHWARIEPVLTPEPQTWQQVSKASGLGAATTQLALVMASRNRLCDRITRDPYDSKKRGSYHKQQHLYFRKVVVQ